MLALAVLLALVVGAAVVVVGAATARFVSGWAGARATDGRGSVWWNASARVCGRIGFVALSESDTLLGGGCCCGLS